MRLADLADRARARGQHAKADRFLLLAWAAYDSAGAPEGTPKRTDAPTAQFRRS